MVKSSGTDTWAFLIIYHVPRLLFNHCSTLLMTQTEQKHLADGHHSCGLALVSEPGAEKQTETPDLGEFAATVSGHGRAAV